MKRKQRFFKLSAIVGCILLGAGMLLCGAGFVGMGCNWNAFTYPRGGEPVAVSSFVEADAVDSIEIHASMGDVKIERASAANPEEVELVLAENVYQVIVQHGLLLVMPQDSYTATGQGGWNWYQLLNFPSDGDWDVTIRVPEKAAGQRVCGDGHGRPGPVGFRGRQRDRPGGHGRRDLGRCVRLGEHDRHPVHGAGHVGELPGRRPPVGE